MLNKTSLVAQMLKRLPAMWETWVRSLGQEDPLEKEMANHSSTLAWKIPCTEEPCRLQFMWLQRARHDWATSLTHSLSANKINNYNRRKKKQNKKSKRNCRTSQNTRIVNIFLESLLSASFPLLGVTVHFVPLGCLPKLRWSLDLLWGQLDPNLVLLLCILASNVHSYQNECIYFPCPFIYSADTESA